MSTVTIASQEEPVYTSARPLRKAEDALRRRRHSSYHTHTTANPHEQDNIQLLLDRFLSELGRRLDFVESYGQLDIDQGIEVAWSTLQQVRAQCAQVSDGVMDAGRRRSRILVETMEERLHALGADTLEQKVQEGVRIMEGLLADFEARAYAMRDSRLAEVGTFIDSSRRQINQGFEQARVAVDEGLEKARRAKESVRIAIDHAVARARAHGLIKYEDLPDPWRVNPHILRGYRFSETPFDCARSILKFSNEMFNIWSHIIGFVIVLAIAFYFYPASPNFSMSSKADVFVAAIFFTAACKCLVCSTLWHTMSSISSQTLLERFACVDYTGISLLIATSIMTTEYTAFYCEPVSRWTYMTTTAVLGVAGTIAPWHPTFNRVDYAWLRVFFYVSLALTGFLPVFQLSFTRGFASTIYFYAPIGKSLAFYFLGACMYAAQIPERWFPGAFDYVGGSHNIWHVAVLGGILFHYLAMQEFFRVAIERGAKGCSAF